MIHVEGENIASNFFSCLKATSTNQFLVHRAHAFILTHSPSLQYLQQCVDIVLFKDQVAF